MRVVCLNGSLRFLGSSAEPSVDGRCLVLDVPHERERVGVAVISANFQVEDFDAQCTANGDMVAVLDADRNAIHKSKLTVKVIHTETGQC